MQANGFGEPRERNSRRDRDFSNRDESFATLFAEKLERQSNRGSIDLELVN